jgi:hypothetical protein
MRVTLRDNNPGHIGVLVHDAEIEPMRLHFDKADLKNIAAMPEGFDTLTCYPDGWTKEECEAHFNNRTPNPPAPGLDPARILSVIEAIKTGSLDAAEAMLREGLPKDLNQPQPE